MILAVPRSVSDPRWLPVFSPNEYVLRALRIHMFIEFVIVCISRRIQKSLATMTRRVREHVKQVRTRTEIAVPPNSATDCNVA